VDTATTAIDTIATIDIIFANPLVDPSPQPLDINALRQGDSVTVQGSVGSVEVGRPVALRFYDNAGNEQIFTTAVQAGGSWSAVVAITALNAFSSWNLQASVADEAGNSAFDDTPSLDVPTLVRLPEAALVSNLSFSDDTTIRIVGYDQLALNPVQSALMALESVGVQLTVDVASDGQSLTAMAGAVLVLDAELNGDDTATVTLYAPITQPTGSDAVFSSIALLATQNDADSTTETVAVNIPIIIRENIDFTVDDSYNAVEQVLTSGNLFDNDVLLEGPLTIIQVELGNVLYEVSALAPTVIANADTKGSLTISSDGNWSFIADRNLDNTVLQQMSFSYSALDQDNDFSSANVVITIADGAGAVFANSSFPVTESDYDQPLSVDQAFVIKAGSDDLDPSLVRFSSELTNLFDDLDYKSTGDAISYTLSNGGKTITATVAGGDVFELVLSATLDAATGNLNATVSLTQELPIDHQSSDDLSFPIVIEAQDNDGTVSSSQATLILEDGNNPTITAVDGAVTEDNLSSAAVFVGDLTVEIGSDTVVDIGFDSAMSSFPNITSGGASLTYTVSADGLLLTASTIAADPVFTVQINAEPTTDADSTLQYTFTLLQGLDQLDANGNSVDPLDLSFKYGVTDFDGDEVFSFINVSVSDASGGGGGPTVDIQLTETPKKLANLSVSNEGSVNFSLTASEDPIVDARFDVSNGDVVVDKSGIAITQNDSPLTWASADDNVIQIRATNGTVVAEFTLPETLSIAPGMPADVPLNISFFQQIDHPQGGPDNITIALDVNFIDSDLTELTLRTEISIFDGLDPIISAIQPLAVDEDAIVADTANAQGLGFGLEGSDTLTGFNVSFGGGTNLFSNGDPVSLAAAADVDGWWIGSASGAEVFRVKFELDGNTDFVLSGPLDHADGSGENDLPINFVVSVNDADGDMSNEVTMVVDVTDDIPIDKDRTIKITEGVIKNINVLKNGEAGADSGTITKITYDNGMGEIDYTFTTNPEVIDLMEVGAKYGTLTVYDDGRIRVETEVTLSSSFLDSFAFEVTDFDGDFQVNTVSLNILDEQASIEISPLSTGEDTAVVLTVVANPGDLDNNESIASISFALAGLHGGSLTLGGVALPVDGSGNPILSGANLVVNNVLTGEVSPNGVLEFTPALNTSDPTNQVVFDVVVTVDSNSGPRTTDDSFDFSVAPIVDVPVWDGADDFVYNLQEDSGSTATNISANLFDTDGSESLSYRIEGIATGLILTAGGNNVSNGQVLSSSQIASLTIAATENLSGQFFFNAVAVAKENSTGDTQELVQQITVNIAPVADTPSVSTFNVNMLEDEKVDLSTFIGGSLADNDGSETLEYELGVPTGWKVTDQDGNEVGLQSAGVYRVTDVHVQKPDLADRLFLSPLEDISSVSGTFSVDVTAIAVESSVGGIAPAVDETRSVTRSVSVEVEGVVDLPIIGAGPDGLWSFDGTNITATVSEDSLIPLNFTTGTEDDDGSEVFDFVLRDLTADVAIVDVDGNAINLPVLGVFNNLPQYAVSAAQLASLYLQPTDDFSGQLTFQLLQTNTEPDGDSYTTELVVDISITPVVDTTNNISRTSIAGEDVDSLLFISPPLADNDGSETLTNATILSLPAGVKILVDFVEVAVPIGGLDLKQLAIDNGKTFDELINDGSLRVRAPEDSDTNFQIPMSFEVTDTSSLGATAVSVVSGSVNVDVKATVDDRPDDGITRIETISNTLVSAGAPISLTGAATFTEEDIDGSEYLDYLSITVTSGGAAVLSGVFISHPNGAINDGNGNWLIPAAGLTSASLVDTANALLNGATIASEQIGVFEVVVAARVLDRNDDADIIDGIVNIEFTAGGGAGVAVAVSDLQTADNIDGQEEQPISLSEHLNSAPVGDSNDVVSYRIDVGDMPYGGAITGSGVIAEYASDGSTVIAFVFTNASLGSLSLTGINPDFAGVFDLPVNKISSDPLGATVVTVENLQVEVAPVVDDVTDANISPLLEDIPLQIQFDINSLLTDSSTNAAEGLESVTSIKFVGLGGGTITAATGILTANMDGSSTLSDASQLDQVFYTPPLNKHGVVSVDLVLTIQDLTDGALTLGQTNPATIDVAKTVSFDVIAVTDAAPILALNQTGIEDNDITFSGLFVVDIDNDGSETLTMQMLGVPAGAILLCHSGSGLQQLVNSGGDAINGFTWTFAPDQLSGLVLRPPADFAGDIELTLQSTSMELSTLDVVTASKDFTVAVLPDADDAYFYNVPSDAAGTEGNVIQVDVFGSTQELVNANEAVVLSIVVDGTTSDATALDGLVGIRTPDGKAVNFVASGANFVAVIATSLSQLENFEFIAGSHAHGSLAVQINIGSKDSATVNGVFETDITDSADFQSKNITIDIAPEPDAPILTLTASTITSGEGLIPLGLSLEEINPATAAGELASIVITGLPEGVLLSDEAVQSGASWIVAAEFVEDLAIKNADIATPFSITIEARSTLNGVTVVGGKQALAINVDSVVGDDDVLVGDASLSNLIIGGKGDDMLTGGAGEDTYLFQLSDIGTAAMPTSDTINLFDIAADHIDLSDIPGSLNTGVELDTIIDLNEATGNTTLTIDLGAGLVQSIVLDGVSKDDLFGSSSWSVDADILTKMLEDQVLLTG
jgi:T1SS-143 domain-containing protein